MCGIDWKGGVGVGFSGGRGRLTGGRWVCVGGIGQGVQETGQVRGAWEGRKDLSAKISFNTSWGLNKKMIMFVTGRDGRRWCVTQRGSGVVKTQATQQAKGGSVRRLIIVVSMEMTLIYLDVCDMMKACRRVGVVAWWR